MAVQPGGIKVDRWMKVYLQFIAGGRAEVTDGDNLRRIANHPLSHQETCREFGIVPRRPHSDREAPGLRAAFEVIADADFQWLFYGKEFAPAGNGRAEDLPNRNLLNAFV